MEEKRRKRKLSDVDSSKSSDDESDLLANKTSAEILNELFGSFGTFEEKASSSKKSKKDKKKKKDKHKHKHKEKDRDREKERSKDKDKEKHKKKDRKSNSSTSSRRVSIAEDQSLGIKIELCKEQKLENIIEKSPTPEAQKIPDEPSYNESSNDKIKNESPIKLEKSKSPELPSVVAKTAEEESTEVFEKQEPKQTPGNDDGVLVGPAKGRIQIKSLKTSVVFEQTIREIEEEARKRAEKFEEGELTPSSSSHNGRGSSSPSLSDVELPPQQTSPIQSLEMASKSNKDDDVKEEKKSRKSRSYKSDERDGRKHDNSRSRSHERRSKDSKRHQGSSRDKHRSHSRDRDRRRDTHTSSRSRDGRSTRHRSRSRDRDRDKRSSRRGSSRDRDRRSRRGPDGQFYKSRDRPEEGDRIDKRKLLAIARRNAMYILREQQERMIQAGVIPGDSVATALPVDSQGGKTVAELTEYCKQLVKSKSMSGSSDDDSDISLSDGEGPTESFIHHPFTLRDRPNAIVMNIRNSTQLPTRSMQEKAAESSKIRSLQFPVSSGQQHRSNEWVPVSPKKGETENNNTSASPSESASVATAAAAAAPTKSTALVATDANQIVDIGSIISQKLSAMRKMQETASTGSATPGPGYGYGYGFGQNPPLGWESGQFTGTTGAKVLTPAELASGQQAWARKDQLKTAAPVAGGMGMKLLQKMGWRPGEGLGKNKEGSLEPLKLDVKMDKKGLVAQEEVRQRFQPFQGLKRKGGGGGGPSGAMPGAGAAPVPVGGGEIFSGKHPVSALVELCTKRHWGAPSFEVVFESGPDHKKNFVFKVNVNNRDYQPNVACGNKKQAKAMAAQHCLEQLGLIVKMPPS